VLEGAKPVLQEVGPYVFTEKHHKADLQWNKNGTVTYKQIRTWNFVPEQTVGSLNDVVRTAEPSCRFGNFQICLKEFFLPVPAEVSSNFFDFCFCTVAFVHHKITGNVYSKIKDTIPVLYSIQYR
jgi:hypothetical protein